MRVWHKAAGRKPRLLIVRPLPIRPVDASQGCKNVGGDMSRLEKTGPMGGKAGGEGERQ